MTFEWDNNKAVSNILKHGITFEEAISVFNDPSAIMTDDQKHSEHEKRELVIGETLDQKILAVVFTRRNQITRLISVRRASRKERKRYEENNNT